jgi:hypothetical protein
MMQLIKSFVSEILVGLMLLMGGLFFLKCLLILINECALYYDDGFWATWIYFIKE